MVNLTPSVTAQEINAIQQASTDAQKDLAARINSINPFDVFDAVEGKEGKEIICPICGSGTHGNKNTGIKPTFENGVWLYHCWANNDCNGDLISIIAAINNLSTKGKDFFQVLAIGAKIIGEIIPANVSKKVSVKKNKTRVKRVQKASEFNRLEEARKNIWKFMKFGDELRGISQGTLVRLEWGFLPDIYFSDAKKELPTIVIPNDEGGVFFRAIDGKFYRNSKPTATTTIFLPNADEFDLVIVEGAINGASILEVIPAPNFGIIASGGTSGNENVLSRLNQLAADGKKFRVMVAYDNDKGGAGQKAAAKLLAMLKKSNIVATSIDITKTADIDLNDILRNKGRGELKEMVNLAVDAAQIELEKAAAELQAAPADETPAAQNDAATADIVISRADFNTILLHAEKISNGQFDFVAILRNELKGKLGIEDANKLIDSIKENPADSDKTTRLFLAQFNFIIEGENCNYRLVKLDDNTVELEEITCDTPAEAVSKKSAESSKLIDSNSDSDSSYLADFNLTEPENFTISDEGVFKVTKKGAERICRQPVIIKSKFYDFDSKIYKLILAYKSMGKWRELPPTERINIFNPKKLIELTNYGLPVHGQNVAKMTDYLDSFFVANEAKLPLTFTTPKFGWKEFNGKEIFLDPRRNSTVEFEGKNYNFITDSDNRFSRALTTSGSIDEWRRVYNLAKDSSVARFMVAAGVASPLLKVLGERNFLLHTYTTSRAGKSTALLLSLSTVGSERLMITFDATKNGLLGAASAANDYVFAVDEKQSADPTILKQIMNFVYSFGGGTGRAKLKKDSSLREIDEWRGIAITTGETELLDDNATAGAHTRLLQIAAPAEILPADICADIRQTVKKNYGHILPRVVDKIFEIGEENLREKFSQLNNFFETIYSQYLPEHRRYISIVTLADYLLNLSLGVDDETAFSGAKDNACWIFELIPQAKDISDAEREKDFVVGFIAEKIAHFEGSENYNRDKGLDCYGRSANDEEYTFITVSALQLLCKDKNLDYKKVVADLVRENFFVPDDKIRNGRATALNTVQKKINGKKANCFRIRTSVISGK